MFPRYPLVTTGQTFNNQLGNTALVVVPDYLPRTSVMINDIYVDVWTTQYLLCIDNYLESIVK